MLDYYIADYQVLAEQIMSIPMDYCKKRTIQKDGFQFSITRTNF